MIRGLQSRLYDVYRRREKAGDSSGNAASHQMSDGLWPVQSLVGKVGPQLFIQREMDDVKGNVEDQGRRI